MRQRVAEKAHYWNNALVYAETNSMGSTNIEKLRSGEYDEAGRKLYAPVRVMPFEMTAQSKPPLIQGLYHALHTQGFRLLNQSLIKQEFRQFVSLQTPSGHWKYEAMTGHDDIVIATALAAQGIFRGGFNSMIWLD